MNRPRFTDVLRLGIRSAVGFYATDDGVCVADVARTPFGIAGLRSRTIDLSEGTAPSEATKDLLHDVLRQGRGKTVTIGVRPSAVDFVADVDRRDEDWQEPQQRGPAAQQEPGVLIDSIAVTAARAKFILTGRVRRKELGASLLEEEQEDTEPLFRQPRYEPGPCAAWRASLFYAPVRSRAGAHLRYILGEKSGLAVLGDRRWPLAWQVMSWKGRDKGAALIQAYHMLTLFARRRLSVHEIAQVSAQGDAEVEEGWEVIETALGREVELVRGPPYGDDLIARGLALGGLDPDDEALDLGRSLRKPKTLLALIPWGEVGFLAAIFLCMFLAMWNHSRSLSQKVEEARRQNVAATWAAGIPTSKLKSEQARLVKEVQPLARFLTRRIPFGPGLAAVSDLIPETAWIESLYGADQVWQAATNKALGDAFLVVRYGAPLVPRGTVPGEIEQLVKRLQESEYFSRHLSAVKLADIKWAREGEGGVTLFTIEAKPEES